MIAGPEERTQYPGDASPATPEWPIEWPIALYAGWWSVMFDAWHFRRAGPNPEDHDLVVPDPIEREGEHALFA